MTAIRSVRAAEGKFIQLTNAAGQDARLSLQARGIIYFVLSLPPEQELTAKWLESQVPNGREAIRSALAELEACGYYRRTRHQNERGHWVWDQVISDTPISGETDDDDAGQSRCGIPSSGNSASGFPSDKRSNTEEPKDVGPSDKASRQAHASASTPRTINEAINGVRKAAASVHSQQEADELSDEEALGLYYTYVGNRTPKDIARYLTKIFRDAPYLDSLLSNAEPVCLRCHQWDSNCKCLVASASSVPDHGPQGRPALSWEV